MIAESKAGGPTTAQGKAARHESRERDLLVTMSAAKRTFATQKARASWTLEWGRKQDGMALRILKVLPPIRAGVMGSGTECQPDGRL